MARRANELRSSCDIIGETQTPRTISKKEQIEKERRLRELEKWKAEKQAKKEQGLRSCT